MNARASIVVKDNVKNSLDINLATEKNTVSPDAVHTSQAIVHASLQASLQASQSAALNVAAQAQALFQGFLQCLQKTEPQSKLGPFEKKGASMLSHFTKKLDEAVAQHANPANLEQFAGSDDAIMASSLDNNSADLSAQLKEQQGKYHILEARHKALQREHQRLQQTTDHLKRELSQRRTQFNNRILVQVFKDHAESNIQQRNGFFEIIPREQLPEFIPFVRNILLGPAFAEQLDSQINQALSPYIAEDGTIEADAWSPISEDENIITIKKQLADQLYSRSERKVAFDALLRRKSPVSKDKLPALKRIFIKMGHTLSEPEEQHDIHMVN